eukprot:SAG11_NODE_1424_length_4949_cov_2.978763_2_plen_228_part_00
MHRLNSVAAVHVVSAAAGSAGAYAEVMAEHEAKLSDQSSPRYGEKGAHVIDRARLPCPVPTHRHSHEFFRKAQGQLPSNLRAVGLGNAIDGLLEVRQQQTSLTYFELKFLVAKYCALQRYVRVIDLPAIDNRIPGGGFGSDGVRYFAKMLEEEVTLPNIRYLRFGSGQELIPAFQVSRIRAAFSTDHTYILLGGFFGAGADALPRSSDCAGTAQASQARPDLEDLIR